MGRGTPYNRSNSYITCCKGCKDRFVGCHQKCEKYTKEKAESLKRKKWEKENRGYILDADDFSFSAQLKKHYRNK